MFVTPLVLSVTALYAPITPKSVTLRYKFHVGEVLKYKTSMSMNMKMNINGMDQPMKISIPTSVSMKVTGVAKDGTGKILTKVTTSAMGHSQAGSATMSISPTGHVSNIQAQGLGAGNPKTNGAVGSTQVFSTLPPNAVTVGSGWDSSVSFGSMSANQLSVHNVVEKISQEGGSTVVTYKSSGNVDVSKMSALFGAGKGVTGTIKVLMHVAFDVTQGAIKSSIGGATMSMNVPQGGKNNHISGTIEIDMVRQ
jgi:hypothetical protein